MDRCHSDSAVWIQDFRRAAVTSRIIWHSLFPLLISSWARRIMMLSVPTPLAPKIRAALNLLALYSSGLTSFIPNCCSLLVVIVIIIIIVFFLLFFLLLCLPFLFQRYGFSVIIMLGACLVFLAFFLKKIIYVCGCFTCMYIFASLAFLISKEVRKGVGSSRTGITDMVVGNWSCVLWKSSHYS